MARSGGGSAAVDELSERVFEQDLGAGGRGDVDDESESEDAVFDEVVG